MEKILLLKKGHCKDVDATIHSGSYTAIIGHTGSGKSTLLMHLNGLLKPSEGVVKIGDTTITAGTKAKGLKEVRQACRHCFPVSRTSAI